LTAKSIPWDPWGQEFMYMYDETTKDYELLSKGPDLTENTDDDVMRP
jgi:hypothetical protein